jgi:hypothetical protein
VLLLITRTQSPSAADADQHALNALPVIPDIQPAGARSLRAMAAALSTRGVATARGGRRQARRSATCSRAQRSPALLLHKATPPVDLQSVRAAHSGARQHEPPFPA